jgi:hypothetical protein
MRRVYIDCREHSSDSNCSLVIAGTEEDVIACAVQHAVAAHGENDTVELREMLRRMLKPADQYERMREPATVE